MSEERTHTLRPYIELTMYIAGKRNELALWVKRNKTLWPSEREQERVSGFVSHGKMLGHYSKNGVLTMKSFIPRKFNRL